MSWFSKIVSKNKYTAQENEEGNENNVSSQPRNANLSADNPIQELDEDVLGRTPASRKFAEHLLALDVSKGVVVGVLGPWGSGKTSFVNLARAYLEDIDIAVLDFNPWMFSGAEQLVESFFIEISAQLKLRRGLAEIGNDLEDYGEIFSGMGWLPFVGPWIERGRMAADILSKALKTRKEGVANRRLKVENALKQLDKPIVVVVDDIDRLSTSEIRDIFKLVRLTANFPNIIYILAFDRQRVEDALAEQGIPGRDYLEKIVQVAIDLPNVPTELLNRQILLAIETTLSSIDNPGPFDANTWPDVFMEVIRPLIRNMRDVRRYGAAIYGTVKDLDGQISLVDVLALEAIRTFLPDAFHKLHFSVEGLTTAFNSLNGNVRESAHLKMQIDQLIEAGGKHSQVIRALIERVFPAAVRHLGNMHYGIEWKKQWLRERRVAHEDILRLYLERVVGEGLETFTYAEQAWRRLADRSALEAYLRSIDILRVEDVISSLEAYEDQFTPEHVVPGVVVLLNLLPDLPEKQGGMFSFGSRLVVGRVVYRLLRSLKDQGAVEKAVQDILPRISSLSSKLGLLTTIGYRENAGHGLVSKSAASGFEKAWRTELRSATADSLSEEKELLRMLLVAKQEADSTEPPIEVVDEPRLTEALLRSALHEVRSQSMGSRAVRRSKQLAWESIVGLYGSEDILRERIEKLKSLQSDDLEELLQLTDKYLSGWRPQDFGDE